MAKTTSPKTAVSGRKTADTGQALETGDDAKRAAETLEQDHVDAAAAATATGDLVYVFANLQSGQSFRLPPGPACPNGADVAINGLPVSRLRGLDGRPLEGGRHGVTTVPAAQWAEVLRLYGKMQIFRNGLVFDAPSLERGKAMARERGGLRHGYEPVNPLSGRVKTKPKSED